MYQDLGSRSLLRRPPDNQIRDTATSRVPKLRYVSSTTAWISLILLNFVQPVFLGRANIVFF